MVFPLRFIAQPWKAKLFIATVPLLNELLEQHQPDDSSLPKLLKVRHQINKMNEIAKKISNIKKYEAMDYVAGVKIVDIDKASWVRNKDDS